MGVLNRLLTSLGRLVIYLQVLCFLPLALDLGGRDCFLAYGASLASYYALLSTFRLAVKRTRFEPVGNFLAAFQIIVVPISLLVCFNVYSPPAESYFAEVRRNAAAAAATASASAGAGGGSAAAAAASPAGVASGIAAVASRAANKLTMGTGSSSSGGGGGGGTAGSRSIPPPPSPPEDLSSLIEWLLTPPTSEGAQRAFAAAVSAFFWLAKRVPPSWSALLRFSSPVFSLLEAVSTLLVIQSVGSLSRSLIAASLVRPRAAAKRAPTTLIGRLMPKSNIGLAELWQILFLLLSAFTYVVSAIILVLSFEGATHGRPGAAAAVGACVSSTLWLTAISFALQRGNVVETSLIAAYVTFNVVQLPDSLAFTADPLALIRSFKYAAAGAAAGAKDKDTVAGILLSLVGFKADSVPPSASEGFYSSVLDPSKYLPRIVIESAEASWNTLGYALAQSIDFIAAAASALPASVIVSLVYRLVVLYAAIRILPRLKANANAHAAAARRNADADRRWAKANAAALSAGRTSRMRGVSASHAGGANGADASASTSASASASAQRSSRTTQPAYTRSTPRNSGVRAPVSAAGIGPLSATGPGRPGDAPPADLSIGSSGSSGAGSILAQGAASSSSSSSSTAAVTAAAPMPVARLGTESEGVPEPFLDADPAGVLDLGLGDETEAEGDGEPAAAAVLLGRGTGVDARLGEEPRIRVNGETIEEVDDGEGELTAAGEKRLRDEEPFGAFISILISYSRLILIAVYSHLLLLDQSHQIYWRFLTIASCLLLWTVEILLGGPEDPPYKLD